MCENGVTHEFRDADTRDRIQAFAPRLAAAGVSPRILHMDGRSVCLERCQPFGKWREVATPAEVAAMRDRVLALLHRMHALGVCHRDVQERNLVVSEEGDQPLLIDFESACSVDPAWPCYDLYGPNEHVAAPEKIRLNYWGSESPVALARTFGPLAPTD